MNIGFEQKHAAHLTPDEMKEISKLVTRGAYMWGDFVKYRDAPRSSVVLARTGEKIIGWGFIYKADNGQAYKQLYVQKGYRGKNIGLDIRKKLRSVFLGEKIEINLGSRTMELRNG